MNEFRIECYVSSDDTQKTKLSSLDKKDMLSWQKDMEARALSEYHNQKNKIKSKKI